MPKPPPDPRLSLLPGTLRPVAELCGFEAVEKLIEKFGGVRLYIPKVTVSAAIVYQCGEPVARALKECFGGDYVVLPLARALATARKHAAILADSRPAGEVARAHGMSVNSVHRIRGNRAAAPVAVSRKPRAGDSGQLDLVDWLRSKS